MVEQKRTAVRALAVYDKRITISRYATFPLYRGVAPDVTRVLHHYVWCYKYTALGYEINNNCTGTNDGGKKAVSYVHVVHIYSNLLRVVYINTYDISYVTKQYKTRVTSMHSTRFGGRSGIKPIPGFVTI